MRKWILALTLFSVILLSILVSANNYVIGSKQITINIQEGWNLVPSSAIFGDLSDNGEIRIQDIRYAYIYDVEQKKYLLLWKDNDFTQESKERFAAYNRENIPQWVLQSSIWVYTEKSGNINLFYEGSPELSEINLVNGWNFLTINPNMVGKTIQKIPGSCDMEKAHYWNANARGYSGWNEIGETNNRFDSENIGTGFIIKVTNDCTLGESTISPPTIPN